VAWHFGFTVLAVGSLLLMLGTLRYFYNSWRWMAVPSQEFSWRQRGWISEDEVVSVNETNGIRLFRSEYLRTEWIDEKLVWHLGNNRAMYFSREHFESDGDWNWICETSSLESASE
ncbi:MAG: hypothetical protein ABJM67_01025, partial [Rhodopirellula bahusiensis]